MKIAVMQFPDTELAKYGVSCGSQERLGMDGEAVQVETACGWSFSPLMDM